MTCEQKGAFITLLCYQHQHGFLPISEDQLMKLCSVPKISAWKKIWSEIGVKFEKTEDGYKNNRLAKETENRKKYSKNKTISGCIAGLISKSKLSPAQKKKLKQDFDNQLFINLPTKDEIKKSVNQWFNQWLNQRSTIVDVDVNTNESLKGGVGENLNEPIETFDRANLISHFKQISKADLEDFIEKANLAISETKTGKVNHQLK